MHLFPASANLLICPKFGPPLTALSPEDGEFWVGELYSGGSQGVLRWHHQLDVSLSKPQETMDREAWPAAVSPWGHKASDTT